MRHSRLLLSIGAALAVVTALASPAAAHGGGDRAESRGGISTSHGKHGHSVKARKDRDRDGLSNRRERRLGTNPFDADTDDDGLKDGVEVRLGLNPRAADSDGDNKPDGQEDTDGDGTPNLYEPFAVGVVSSFATNGTLTIDPNGDGAAIVVTVDAETDIDVASRYHRHRGWHRSSVGVSGQDHDEDDDADTDLLVTGAVVLKLKVADDATVTRIVLAPKTT